MTHPVLKRAERWPLVWAAIVTVLLVALAGTFIAYLHATTAIKCTNDALGDRTGVTRGDQQAHIAYAVEETAYDHALNAVLATPGAGKQRAYRTFVRVSQAKQRADDRYVAVLQANQAYRDLHPLGTC